MRERTRPLDEAITAVSAALESVANPSDDAAPVAASRERVQEITDLLSRLLAETPDAFLSNGLITALAQQLQQVSAALQQVSTDPAAAAVSLDTAADNVLAALGTWPPGPRLDEKTGQDIARAIERRVDRASTRIERRAGEITALVSAAEEKLGEQREAVDQAVSTAVAGIDAKASEVATALTATKTSRQ